MVKLKFVIRNGFLALRISEGTERFYRSAMAVLVGNLNLDKQWDSEKERFIRTSPSYKENNASLQEFKAIFSKLIIEHPDFTARQIAFFHAEQKEAARKEAVAASGKTEVLLSPTEYSNSVEKFLQKVIQREKAKTGCNFETYQRLLSKCRKIVPGFSELKFSDIDYDKCIWLASIFGEHKGYVGTTKQFRNMLGKASRDRDVKFHLYQIGDFKFPDYNPNKDDEHERKPDVLTQEQIIEFLKLDTDLITPTYRDRFEVRMYHDFCVFMLNSFLAPCDVLNLKRKNITKNGTILAKRKKTHRPIEIPVTPAMQSIINRYSGMSKDGYIFPILDDSRASDYKTRDYLFKKYREKLNIWLKEVGKLIHTPFQLYAYVFRHTSITFALDNGLPITYVSRVAGTSVEMIERHYYNGDNLKNNQKLQLMFIKVCNQ